MPVYNNNIFSNSLVKATLLLSFTLIISIILGITLSNINDMKEIENLLETKKPSKPSRLYDRNGELITEFYSDEKKDNVTIDKVPNYLVQGLILWEDENFYQHRGFNIFAITRASLNNLLHRPVSGASTLTQQLARTLFLTNRFSWNRKFKELWLSLQLEKKYTKNEILTLYLNNVPLGFGTNGVQAAAKYYFNKNIDELNYAEAASIITIISNPTLYSFNKFPEKHKQKQKQVLNKMVKNGVISPKDAETSFNDFWLNWKTSGLTTRGAFYNRDDKAPYFSDWVLTILNKELPNVNVYKDGLEIYSTLDLKMNILAEKLMQDALDKQQKIFEDSQKILYRNTQDVYIDSVLLLGDVFSLTNLNVNKNRSLNRIQTSYNRDINPNLNLLAQTFGLDMVNTVTDIMFNKDDNSKELLAQVQGAFVTIDNKTGQILTMIGGKKFDLNNRFNYAMQAKRQPGSAFKPLIYSYAFDTGLVTPGTVVVDEPYVFTFNSSDEDEWYKPYNYSGTYNGRVTLRMAIRRSLNIPACKVFYLVGFHNHYKDGIDRAASLLGLKSQDEINERIKPELSTVLGTGSVAPIEMATAYSTFANYGKRITPNSILYVQDRDGNIIYEPWKELDKYYRENSSKLQIITPQNAYLITSILKDTFTSPDATLTFVKQVFLNEKRAFPINVDFAAKSGSSQNWSDAWVIGYSPLVTTAAWVGFDKYGLSLGVEQSGSMTVGGMWLEYMRQYHLSKSNLTFEKPNGIVTARICRQSGLLPSPYCDEKDLYYENFLPNTVPTKVCDYCKQNVAREENNIDNMLNKFNKKFNKTDINNVLKDPNDNINVDRSILSKHSHSNTNIDKDLSKIDIFNEDLLKGFEDNDIDKKSNDSQKKQSSSPQSTAQPNNRGQGIKSDNQSSLPNIQPAIKNDSDTR